MGYLSIADLYPGDAGWGDVLFVSIWAFGTLLLAAYLMIFYPMVIRREQMELKTLYGGAFDEYASRVPAFWPRLSPAKSSDRHFSWMLYRQNREYEAAIGLAVAMAILWLLMMWPR